MCAEDEQPRLRWRMFWVALLVRLAYMTFAHQYKMRLVEDHFQFGWEAGRIARALVTGFGYSDCFANIFLRHTGPTAWLPPLYPLLIAAVFRVFGVYSLTSSWVLLAINCLFSAATAMAAWEIGVRCFGPSTGLWAGWIWALYPAFMQYAVHWIWEMTITTALFAWVIVLALRMREQPTVSPTRRWAIFGLAWGAIALSNATLLAFLPFCGLWVLHKQTKNLPRAILAAVIFLACVTPWTIRNAQVFHTFIPLRGNLGVELMLGNGPGSNGLLMEYNHPFQDAIQLRQYAAMGEVRYVAMRGAMAKDYMRAHPAHLVADSLKRVFFFWASVPHPADHAWIVEYGRVFSFSLISLCGLLGLALAMARRIPGAGLFFWAFLLLPIAYYFVTVHARFRHPLEPLICVLGAYLFQSADRTRTWSWQHRQS